MVSTVTTSGVKLSPRAQSWIVMAFIGLSLLAMAWYIVPYLFNVSNSHERFADTSSSTSATAIKKAREAISSLPEPDQRRVCEPTVSKITAYRSLYTGAAFKLEESTEGSGQFFLYGPDMRVVEVAADGSGALGLAIRNENPNRQLFVREIAVKQMDGSDIATGGGETCYVFTPKSDPNMALQYEHEHLSLRPLNRAPASTPDRTGAARPFIGQCFIRFQATEEELNSQALVTGLGIPQLAAQHLANSGPTTGNANGSGVSSPQSATPALAAMTQEIEQQARTPAVRDYGEYQAQTGGPGTEVGAKGNPFANKPIQVNLNLGMAMAQDGFSADATGAASRNPASAGATSVRALLDKYTAQQLGQEPPTSVSDKEMAINKAYRAAMNDNATATSGVGEQVVGCPVIDRSEYYTERQLAQCAGCIPDDFLRGK